MIFASIALIATEYLCVRVRDGLLSPPTLCRVSGHKVMAAHHPPV